MRASLVLAAVICLQPAASSTAYAWSGTGHKIVCQIAYEELTAPVRARVDALIAMDPQYRTFADSCTWPDIRPRARPTEHYVNVPRSVSRLDAAKPCPEAERCVVSAIVHDAAGLASTSDAAGQLELLKNIGHWVGDLHQPLHVAFRDDRLGNKIATSGQCRTMHAVWDKCIIKTGIGTDYAAAASKLRAEITDADRAKWVPRTIDTATVVSWANESLALARKPSVQYCVRNGYGCWYTADQMHYRGGPKRGVIVDRRYLAGQAPAVRERLKRAGVRLAAILNTVFAAKSTVH